ncbi:M20/M25/M40 family metallo-hydrolase [Chryseobacterium indologenes]|uniref:M20/M25/M40 family metallo-hydrolase n=1 Tax=Chryseobacterium indologenes TaxID=253 RepID=UPI000BFCE05F|nr:M20/M25/M40 family metallo-hydrolase [Chryseobacterium indologenes]ATN04987.1 peptidase M28 [Chryseobacterium indologenes]AYY86261.1 M20/M25/M40 family metallo-hydrolase [Chryseobacterium indologenes]AYZ36036.1 M20/M25/M40 family metallo-hydrolase [Chryseobacterium indologenes]MBF6644823.1 M20/M25/M40 family metallo-hydrolase [Chryseobacterium indologenes]MBU3047595.1 M20/M25/M40 family metallo-hydrolase [Chryseobacterium indologenes]
MKYSLFLLFIPYILFSQKLTKDDEVKQYVSQVNEDSLKSYIGQLVNFQTRHTLSSVTDPHQGIGAARNWVIKKFKDYAKKSGGSMEVYLQQEDLQPDGKRIDKAVNLGNAVAFLKGKDPDDNRVFLIGAHLDSRVTDVMNRTSVAPGANDDGSGVSAVIEAARILSASSFPASIIFVAFSGEEQSLLGSKMLAEKIKKENVQLEAVLNNDMIGNPKSGETGETNTRTLRVFSEGLPYKDLDQKAMAIRNLGFENDSESRQLARYIKEISEQYVKDLEVKLIYRNDRFLRGGDHSSFVNNGFPSVRLTEYYENYDHQHQDIRIEHGKQFGDLPEFIDFKYLKKNVAANIAVLANLAKSTSKPEQVEMDVKQLTNSTTLHWQKPKSGVPSGYYVLARETDSPVWQKRIWTKELSIRIPLSKDNYIFAVQAVSQSGNLSVPVIPGIAK